MYQMGEANAVRCILSSLKHLLNYAIVHTDCAACHRQAHVGVLAQRSPLGFYQFCFSAFR